MAAVRPSARADPRAEALARTFLALADECSPGLVDAFHLTGSAVLGDWRPGASDLDIVAVLARAPSRQDVAGLRRAHARFAARPCAPRLDGPWLAEGALARPPSSAPPGLASREGAMVEGSSAHRDPVTWRTLARYGVALRGARLTAGDVADDEATLQSWLLANLRDYWGGWRDKGDRLATRQGLSLLLPWGVVWATLGVARQLYTLETGDIASKRNAGLWAAGAYPAWAPILSEAVRLRVAAPGRGPYATPFARRKAVVRFLEWAVEQGACPTGRRSAP